ncbi:Multifunctional cyclase-dehydratase-3-O-methyl transferase TcmN [Aquisphaera giovannonii]|uniref:Multifunctional cyclase-dehydratase-3-O-methyl transferase TcmN n=1 Tax=Aquisphaera giovannonii TaxID=406548 RepID=A0A5B9WAJ4_9BACT|nr:methyltransferase [Aquisphaera giovannonii]QEH37477.1 Multifunctional cyclase-dehydratase-3-O-methyl transferase TcmN [Aquisphaera giovannonii]
MMKPDPATVVALQNLIVGKWLSQALSVAAKLGIADLLGEGPRVCDDLAQQSGADPSSLYRVLRALAGVGVFKEVESRRFELTPMAGLLRSGVPGSLRAVAIMAGEDWTWRPWGKLEHSVRTGERGFDAVFGMPPFEYLPANPEAAAVFDAAMTGWSMHNAAAVAQAYDFSGIGTLMDVGGGHGFLLATILKANPSLRGVLFEMPTVCEGARSLLAAEGLSDRTRVAAGSFFEPIGERADACILKSVIHDWDDAQSTTILRHCREAVGPRGRVLLAEMVIPPGNGPDFGKLLDLEMLVVAGGRERTEAEYRGLLAGAGLRMTRVVRTASPSCVIESVVA